MDYALINTLGAITRNATFNTGEVPQLSPDKGLRWLEIVGTAPAYDPATQRLDGPVYTVGDNQVDAVYTIVNLTPDEVIAKAAAPFEAALENMLDTKARERTWKDCMSARAAAGYPSSFQPEGIAFVNWWAACWELAHTILPEVQGHLRPIPTVEEFLAEMPELVLP